MVSVVCCLKNLPANCPSCSGALSVTQLRCPTCETEVRGEFPLPPFSRLSAEEQEFVLRFVLSSGSLKEMAGLLGVSYPTVRNRLNDVIEKLKPAVS